MCDVEKTTDNVARQVVAQLGTGIDEGPAGQLQAHEFHEHLIAVGRAVERAGTRGMVGRAFGGQQLLAAATSCRIIFADLRFLFVGKTRDHRPCRSECGRQMTERECPDQETWDDLVADAQAYGRVENIVR